MAGCWKCLIFRCASLAGSQKTGWKEKTLTVKDVKKELSRVFPFSIILICLENASCCTSLITTSTALLHSSTITIFVNNHAGGSSIGHACTMTSGVK